MSSNDDGPNSPLLPAESLSESEARYRTLFEHAPDAIVVFDLATGRFVEANENATRLFGHSRDTLLTMGPVDVSPALQPDGRASEEAAREYLGRAMAGETPVFEWTHRNAAGKAVDCEIRLVRMPPNSRQFVRGSITDVSERKAANAELARRERMFRTLAENSPDWIVRLDRDLRRIYVNPSVVSASGSRAEDLLGKRPTESFPGSSDMEAWEEGLRLCIETGRAQSIERETNLGERRVLQTSIVPELDGRGNIESLLSVTRDITSVRRALEAEERLAGIVESASEAMMSSDLEGKITSWNRGAEQLFGFTAAEVLGKTTEFLFPTGGVTRRAEIRSRTLAGETIESYVGDWPTADGRIVTTETTFFPLRNAAGDVVGTASIARDLTEERSALRALEVSEERLRLALETAQMGTWSYHPATDTLEVSANAARIYGRTPEGMPRSMRDALTLVHPDDREETRRRVVEGIPASTPPREYRILQPDGAYRWISSVGEPVEMDGTVSGIIMDIHPRKLAEEALRESEERFRAVVESVSAGVWVHNGQEVLMVNSAFEYMTGYDRAQLLGRGSFARFVSPEQLAVMEERGAARMRGEPAESSYEIDVTRADGELRHLELSARVIDFRGSPASIISAFDVTERKQAEEALRESEERFRAVVNSAAVGMIIYDGAGIVEANPAAGLIFGVPAEKLMEPGFLGSLTDEQSEREVRARGQARLRGEDVPPAFEAQARTVNGEPIYLHMNATTIELAGKRVSLVTMIDVTEQRLAANAVAESEARFRSLVDNSPDFITRIGRDLRHEFVNRTAQFEAGLDPAMVIGKRADEIGFPPELGALWLARHREVLETGEALEFEYEIAGDGEDAPVYRRARLIPEISDSGEVHHILSIVTDITAERTAEEERRRLDQQMQHAQKLESLGVLAGGIAHDFNNLLVAMLGNAGLALMELPPESPARQTVQAIELAAQRAAELTRQMLAYSGRGRFIIEPLQLSRVVEEMAHLLEVSISKQATLKFRFAPDLPAIEGDATQIRQVVMNLIINASDAIGDRSGVISVSTGMLHADRAYFSGAYLDGDLPEGDYAYLEVADSGIGMDEETRARIFDPFFTTKFTGRGLGLAAVLGIVRGHRGAIKLYSEVGRGTTFKVLLPVAASSQATARATPDAAQRGAAAAATILVIDDDETVRTVTRRMLEVAGHSVLLAVDGEAGVEAYSRNAGIDLVLLDMTMPRMDGEQTFRELRRLDPGVRVILTSGYNEQDATERFAGKGLAGFIQKPYRPAELIERIAAVLNYS